MKKCILTTIALLGLATAFAAAPPMSAFQVKLTSASSSEDKLILVEGASYSDAFDYAVDNEKIISITNPSVNTAIYVPTNIVSSGRADKLGTNNLVWKYIGVMTNTTDVTYTFTFSAATYMAGRKQLYLLDHEKVVITPILKDTFYTFTLDAATATNTHITNRFQIVDEEFLYYHRDVASGNWATVCFPYKFLGKSGAANLYSLTAINTAGTKVALDVVAIDDVVAGKPYIFQSDSTAQEFKYKPENKVAAPAQVNGLNGVFADSTLTEQKWVITNNAVTPAAVKSFVPQYRCFIDLGQTPVDDAVFTQQIPGRRIFNVKNTPTGMEMLKEVTAMDGKMIINGKLVIIKDGKMFNAQGAQL